jgi:hypothetical protein
MNVYQNNFFMADRMSLRGQAVKVLYFLTFSLTPVVSNPTGEFGYFYVRKLPI